VGLGALVGLGEEMVGLVVGLLGTRVSWRLVLVGKTNGCLIGAKVGEGWLGLEEGTKIKG